MDCRGFFLKRRNVGDMDDLFKEVVPLLQYLIPGFMATWIFYSLTAYKRPDSFGQIIQALIFTFIIQSVVVSLEWISVRFGYLYSFGQWGPAAQSVTAGIVAITLGLVSCKLANNDKLHTFLRAKKITKQASFPSEWFSAFLKRQRFVILHLKDERRLYGWPEEWPSQPSNGQFVIGTPSWINEAGDEMPLKADAVLIDSKNVQWVEFIPKTQGVPRD
jgi:hypothetical protein